MQQPRHNLRAALTAGNGVPAATVHRCTVAQAAKLTGVSERSVYNVLKIMREAPDLVPQLESGQLTIGAATKAMQARKQSAPVTPIHAPITKYEAMMVLARHLRGPKGLHLIRHEADDIADVLETLATAYMQDRPAPEASRSAAIAL